MTFANFWNILWIPLLIPTLVWVSLRHNRRGRLRFSTVGFFRGLHRPGWLRLRHLLIVLRITALILLIVALMRPREGIQETRVRKEGVDVVLSLDASGSMRAEDFQVDGRRRNRLYVVKKVVGEFVRNRTSDRLGLVVFGDRAYTLCPLTLDSAFLLQFLDRAQVGIAGDGTAIGEGIATALNRLKRSKAKSRVVILLTDGVHNAGRIDPQTAAELAKSLKIKIYTIGVGSKGPVPYPEMNVAGRILYTQRVFDLDEKALKEIAETTGGRYFRATATEELEEIYREIDRLEKSAVEVNLYMQYRERFGVLVFAAMGLMLAEILLGQTWLKTLP